LPQAGLQPNARQHCHCPPSARHPSTAVLSRTAQLFGIAASKFYIPISFHCQLIKNEIPYNKKIKSQLNPTASQIHSRRFRAAYFLRGQQKWWQQCLRAQLSFKTHRQHQQQPQALAGLICQWPSNAAMLPPERFGRRALLRFALIQREW
jgi:hypothetical protein